MKTNNEPSRAALLNEHDVAQLLDVSVATIRRWRLLQQGPRFLKLGTLCKYRTEDITLWLESRPCGGSNPEVK